MILGKLLHTGLKPVNLTQGISHVWEFTETPPGPLFDLVGTSNGTGYGATLYLSGKFNASWRFGGNGQYALLPAIPIHKNVTLAVWVLFINMDGGRTIMIRADDYWLRLDSYQGGFAPRLFVHTLSDWKIGAAPNVVINLSEWYHFVFTWDADDVRKFYVNGLLAEVRSDILGAITGTNQQSCFAGFYTSHSGAIRLTQVAWWSRVLPHHEIRALYNYNNGLAYSNW